jgi:hypothetical protein
MNKKWLSDEQYKNNVKLKSDNLQNVLNRTEIDGFF